VNLNRTACVYRFSWYTRSRIYSNTYNDFIQVLQPQVPTPGVRPRRANAGKLPPRYLKDMLPSNLIPIFLTESSNMDNVDNTISSEDATVVEPSVPVTSHPNRFGLYREFTSGCFSAHDPEDEQTRESLFDLDTVSSNILADSSRPPSDSESYPSAPETNETNQKPDFWPYPNRSSFLLADWYWSNSIQKSKREFSKLINIIGDKDFLPSDICSTPWASIDKCLSGGPASHTSIQKKPTCPPSILPFPQFHWIQDDVKIQVPFHRNTQTSGKKDHLVGTFFHRSIVEALKEKVSGPDFKHFNLQPFQLRWRVPFTGVNDTITSDNTEAPSQRIYGEVYSSDSFLKAHREIQQAPSEPADCKLPRVVAALMFASDKTHLTQFGENKLWPLYLCFGNESKYRRCQPNLHLYQHIAYFIKVNLANPASIHP
jgi:hypothetical protein